MRLKNELKTAVVNEPSVFEPLKVYCNNYFQIKTHLQDMYTHPDTAEQCLHNALKIANAMRYAGIDYDIQVGMP